MLWKILPKKSNDLTEQLLYNRNITGKKEIEQFLSPKISDFEKDLQISGIKRSQERIERAIKNNELIIAFGDYDVDGICALTILYKGLTYLEAKVLPYIPHREKEGYGLSKLGLDFAKENKALLVITVDNGIVAVEQAKYAKSLGLDLIITDHHIPGDEKPQAYEIVHSTKMCGAAVAWCLIRNLIKKELAEDLLQFAAIATVCDLLPLIGLGRSFTFEGLKILNKTANPGLLALISESGINPGNITSYEVGYIIGPRLNATGRLSHAIDSLRLLCTKDLIKAKKLSKLLCDTNSERKHLTTVAIEQARTMLKDENRIHVLYSKEWSVGIIGLIAGKITDEYFRPTIAISLGETVSKGSARSIDGINIVELIRKHSDILIDVGGHPGAAGFSILSKHIEIFKKRLQNHVINLAENEKILEIDVEVETNKINKSLVQNLQKFAPFGFKNPKPIFASFGLKISDIKTVGAGKHLKFKVVDPEQSRRTDGMDCIAFGMGELIKSLANGQLIDLAFTPQIDTYNGFEKIQLKVKDIKIN